MGRMGRRGADPELGVWLGFVRSFAAAYAEGAAIPPPACFSYTSNQEAKAVSGGPKVLLCSPHPDDESLSGALALRLQQEGDAGVLNLAMTLGGNPAWRQTRRQELTEACGMLGFGCLLAAEPAGFSGLHPDLKKEQSASWQQMVMGLAAHFEREKPSLVCLPHVRDHHPTHEATHLLAMEALGCALSAEWPEVVLAETQYWHPLADPNVLVGLKAEDLALLLAALSHHRGEVDRYPYHLFQPARMMENCRRGAERLQGYGGGGPCFLFGELYRVSLLRRGSESVQPRRRLIAPPSQPLRLADLLALFD